MKIRSRLTWTVPMNVSSVNVELVGGGGNEGGMRPTYEAWNFGTERGDLWHPDVDYDVGSVVRWAPRPDLWWRAWEWVRQRVLKRPHRTYPTYYFRCVETVVSTRDPEFDTDVWRRVA